jgi:gamma-glutamyltranspeptidase/glutathione hydrolase
VQVLSGILDEGLDPQEAVDRRASTRPGRSSGFEPGFADEALTALEEAGYDVRRFSALHHYFGGVSLLARSGGAADPRRSGAALTLP